MDEETPEQEAERLARGAEAVVALERAAVEDLLFSSQIASIEAERAAQAEAAAALTAELTNQEAARIAYDLIRDEREILAQQDADTVQQSLLAEAAVRIEAELEARRLIMG